MEPIQPQPSTYSFFFKEAVTGDGKVLCVVEIYHIAGMIRVFLNPDDAENIAEHWVKKVKKLKYGLYIPQNGNLPSEFSEFSEFRPLPSIELPNQNEK